jgi:prolyl-tRNA editing enzyme YbaK/EbsC (Cys-tRNA(Pro) deacylase)
MSIEKVKEYFRGYGMEDRVQEFPVSSATVALAAEALGCAPCRIAKTLSFLVEDRPILIVAAGDARVDNAKYKARFGVKAKMLSPDQAVDLVGHAVGGVCPFGLKDGVTVYLDESLKRFETVFPACGSSNSAIELTIPELERYSGFTAWVDVCKDWTEAGDASAG